MRLPGATVTKFICKLSKIMIIDMYVDDYLEHLLHLCDLYLQ